RVDDFALLEARSPEVFDGQARSFLEHPGRFNSAYEMIFDEAGKAGMDIAIVLMPISPVHRSAFYSRPMWAEYLAAVEALARSRGIRVIDDSAMFSSEDQFADHVHMTQPTALQFSAQLGGQLAEALRKLQ